MGRKKKGPGIKFTTLVMENKDDFEGCVETFINAYEIIDKGISYVLDKERGAYLMWAFYKEKK